MANQLKYGVIISIEDYISNSVGLPKVKYANNDAALIREIFQNQFGIPDDCICELINEKATYQNCGLHGELKYFMSGLEQGATVYLYYAGHGFFSEGENYLTVYDTSMLDLTATSLSINSVFLEMFKKSQATTLFAFIDACAESINKNTRSVNCRGLNFDSLDEMVGFKYAFYFSCSPNERSLSSDQLTHGIWTHFFNEALHMKAGALNEKGSLTVRSLQEYLKENVYDYALKIENAKQTPYLKYAANSDIVIINSCDEKTFEEKIELMEEEFFNKTYLVYLMRGDYTCDYRYSDLYGDYSYSERLCRLVPESLPEDWLDTLNELNYHAKRVRTGQKTMITYEEQLEVEKRILDFINSIDTSDPLC